MLFSNKIMKAIPMVSYEDRASHLSKLYKSDFFGEITQINIKYNFLVFRD